jgi:hypothetical protein
MKHYDHKKINQNVPFPAVFPQRRKLGKQDYGYDRNDQKDEDVGNRGRRGCNKRC